MRKHRYMLIDLVRAPGSTGVFKSSIHGLVQNYHYHVVGDNVAIASVSYDASKHTDLLTHSHVTILPSESSPRGVLSHIGKTGKNHHAAAIQKHLGVDATHTMDDLIDMAVSKYGSIFAPDN